jgi:hypothetical protein
MAAVQGDAGILEPVIGLRDASREGRIGSIALLARRVAIFFRNWSDRMRRF